MLGIQEALMGWLLQGQQRTPAVALEKGVVDQLVATREERELARAGGSG